MNIKDIIHMDYSDSSYLINRQNLWLEADLLDRKLLHQIKPHSDIFNLPIKVSSYLFHIKKLDQLNLFPIFFARDGLISIFKFFFKFQEPINTNTILMLPKQAASFIPKSWANQCLLWEIGHDEITQTSKANKTLAIATLIPNSMDLDLLEKKLDEIFSKNENFSNVDSVFLNPKSLGDESFIDNSHLEFNFYKSVFKHLNNIQPISWQSLKESSVNYDRYINLDQFKLFYNDSYLENLLCSKGILPYEKNLIAFDDKDCLRVSQYHFIKFSYISDKSISKSEQNWKETIFMSDIVFDTDFSDTRSAKDFSKVSLCSVEMIEFVKDLCKQGI